MRAKCVYEKLEFERGGDPKEKMRIGQASSYIHNVVRLLTEDMTEEKVEYKVKEGIDEYNGEKFKLVQIYLPIEGEYTPEGFIKTWGRKIHEYHNNLAPLNAIDRAYVEVGEGEGEEPYDLDIIFYSKSTNEFFGTDSRDSYVNYHYVAEQDFPYLKDYKKDMPGGSYGVILNLYITF